MIQGPSLKKTSINALIALSGLIFTPFEDLNAQVNVSGQILNRDGQIIKNKEVFAKLNGQVIAKTTTDNEGFFSFENLNNEAYVANLNPPSGNLTTNNPNLNFSIPDSRTYFLSVSDILGRSVLRQQVNDPGVYNIGVNGLAAGTYLVNLQGPNVNTTQKITILNSNSNNISFNRVSNIPQRVTTSLDLIVREDNYYNELRQTIIDNATNLILIPEDKVDTLETRVNLYSNQRQVDGNLYFSFNNQDTYMLETEDGKANISLVKPVRYNSVNIRAESEDKLPEDITINLTNQININLKNAPRQYTFSGQILNEGETQNATIQILNLEGEIIQSFRAENGAYNINTILDLDKIHFRVLTDNKEITNTLELKDTYIKKDFKL